MKYLKTILFSVCLLSSSNSLSAEKAAPRIIDHHGAIALASPDTLMRAFLMYAHRLPQPYGAGRLTHMLVTHRIPYLIAHAANQATVALLNDIKIHLISYEYYTVPALLRGVKKRIDDTLALNAMLAALHIAMQALQIVPENNTQRGA